MEPLAPNSVVDRDDITREMLNTFPVGVAIVNYAKNREGVTGERLFMNTAFIRLFGGKSGQDLVGQNVADSWVDPERLKEFETIMEVQEELIDFEAKRARIDGQEIWLSLHSRRVLFENKNCKMVWHFDITERKNRERLSKNLFAAIESLSEGVTIFDAEDRLLYANKSWRVMNSAMPENHVIGTFFKDHVKVLVERDFAPDARGKESEWITERLNRHQNPGDPFELQRDDVRLLVNEQRLPDGGIVILYTDITERVELEKRLSQSLRLEAIGKLTGGVAHDFNNLLAVIMGNLELLQDEVEDEKLTALIDAGIAASRRGGDLTKNMLSFARQARLDPTLLELNGLVTKTKNWIGQTLPSNIEVETSLLAGLWKIEADPGPTESALLNLILNARDAMPDGGKLTIETANIRIDEDYIENRGEDVAPGRYVMLAVSDTGHGIDQEIMESIFEPFFSTKPPSSGSGLGLSTVQGFMKQSHGTIRVYSEPGIGTTVKLYFKAFTGDAAKVPTAEKKNSAQPSFGVRILVVEDEPDVLDVLVSTLSNAGYVVSPASSGDEAKEMFEAGLSFDVLLTDIVMPGTLQGTTLARFLRERLPDLPVVFMSGYAREATVHGNGLHPEDIRLMKPVSRADLINAIETGFASVKNG